VKTRAVLWTLALVVLLAVTAVAADVSGKWVAQVPGRGGNTQETTFNFKVSGATLTGSVTNPRGETEISEGKASADEVSFVVVPEVPGYGNEDRLQGQGRRRRDSVH